MVFRIVIAGESQCNLFAQVCLLADYLQQNLSNFCYQRIEKSVLDWKHWLIKINKTYKWHHTISPIIWKELLIDGSKPVYIGSTQEFLEYCYSYYHFDVYLAAEKLKCLSQNYTQFEKKHRINYGSHKSDSNKPDILNPSETYHTVSISGASSYITMYLVSGLLELCTDVHKITTIYIFDMIRSTSFVELIEKECNFINTNRIGKVKLVKKYGHALTDSDILIILDHEPFRQDLSIGAWLNSNRKIMKKIASTINICGSSNMRIIFPNLGPACYNATILADRINNANRNNIVVATSDLGMDIASLISEVAEVPLQNIFCPPVWGFVGINHLVDIKTTIHRYDAFTPFDRYGKVKSSTLCIGTITPEMRTMEYIFYFDDTFWRKLVQRSASNKEKILNKAVAVVNIVKIWLYDPDPEYVINLGVMCDGTFGLSFKGIFSQPVQLIDGEWRPAKSHLLPKDSQLNVFHLQDIANMTLKLGVHDLPPLKTND